MEVPCPARARVCVVALAAFLLLTCDTAISGGANAPPGLGGSPLLVFSPLQFLQPAVAGRGPSFYRMTAGSTTRAQVESSLGRPTSGGATESTWTGTSQCRRFDLKKIMARYNAKGVLSQLMLEFGRPESLAGVRSVLRLTTPTSTRQPNDKQGQIRIFKPQRAALLVRNGAVTTVWLTSKQRRASPDKPPPVPFTPPSPAAMDPPDRDPRQPRLPMTPEFPTAPSAAPTSLRSLHVKRVWCEQGVEHQGKRGLGVCGHVLVEGLQGLRVQATATLRRRDGTPVQAAPGAPREHVGTRGQVQGRYAHTVDGARADWKKLWVFIPYTAATLPPPPYVVGLHVACGGLVSMGEAEAGAAVSLFDPTGRALRLTRVAVQHNAQAPRGGEGGRPGFLVNGYLEVEGFGTQPQPTAVTMRLHHPNGQPVRKRKAGKPFVASAKGSSRDGRVPPFWMWYPYHALDLAPGRTHRVVMSYAVSCGGLTAALAQECVLQIPGTGSTMPPTPPAAETLSPEIARVRAAIAAGTLDPNAALRNAAAEGRLDVARFLLDNRADVSASDSKGTTPLHLAAIRGDERMVALLLERGADPRAGDNDGDTPSDLTRSQPIAAALGQATAQRDTDPENAKVRQLVDAFIRATLRGDGAAVSRFVAADSGAERWSPAEVPRVPIRHRVDTVRLRGNAATATVMLTCPKMSKHTTTFKVTVKLHRTQAGWQVTDTDLEPYWADLDQQEGRR